MVIRQLFVLLATSLGVFLGMFVLMPGSGGAAKVLLGLGLGTVFGLVAALYQDRARI